MTNVRGRSFVSYRRSAGFDVRKLVDAQHVRGIPTWQDISNLDAGPTEDQLREIIRDPDTANGVMWLTRDVSASPTIMRVEAPELFARARMDDQFFLIPIATGGFGYDDAAEMFLGMNDAADLRTWNLRKEPDSQKAATKAAQLVLQRRVRALHETMEKGEPVVAGLYVREPAPQPTYQGLLVDWSRHINKRVAPQATWNDVLLPALGDIAHTIRVFAPGRPVVAEGQGSVPSAIALGYFFSAEQDARLAWRQRTRGRSDQLWSLDVPRVPTGFAAVTRADDVSGTALAVLVSVTENVRPALSVSHATTPSFRAIVEVSHPERRPPHDLSNAGEALDVAKTTIEATRRARSDYLGIEQIHVFAAVPFGLAALLGQLLNTLGPVQTYEHVPVDARGRYELGCRLSPIH